MSGTLIADGLAQARDALAGLTQVPLFGLSGTDVLELQDRAVAVVRQAEAVLVALAGQGEACRAGQRGTGARSAKDVLVRRLRLSTGHATKLLDTAQALRDSEFAPTAEAFAAGAIGAEHARRITAAVKKLPKEVTGETRGLVQEKLLDVAAEYDPDKVARFGKDALHVVDPDLADRILGKQLEKQERDAARERTLWFKDTHEGLVHFGGRLDAASARAIRTALSPLTKPTAGEKDGSEDSEHGERRTYGQRQADALVELVHRTMQAGHLPKHGGEPTQLVLTMRLNDLLKGLGAAFLPTGEAISAAQARKLACDAAIIPAVLGTNGVPLDVGRAKRHFEGKLRRALDLRDGGCAFPGCDIPAAWCDAHHIRHWWEGGKTSLDNGVLLCRHHHHSTIHHDGWTVRMAGDGRPEFLPPPWIDPEQQPRRNRLHHSPHAV